MNYCKRRPPKEVGKRLDLSNQMKLLSPLEPINKRILGLSSGNTKTGKSGMFFEHIFVWNLPPFATCPGCSEWCYSHCYNADERNDIYPINSWCENWWAFLNNRFELKKIINAQLSETLGRKAVRIHSSGDFFSIDYILFWKSIISENPDVKFWAYTRSWAVEKLNHHIRELNELQNISLFASYDATMYELPHYFPISYVFDDTEELLSFANAYGGFVCPEQFCEKRSCADCGYCMTKASNNVLFLLH